MANNNTTIPPCTEGSSYWDGEACQDCDPDDPVLAAWIDEAIEFTGVSATNTATNARTAITNVVDQTVAVRPLQIPTWVTLTGGTPFDLPDNFVVNGTAAAIPAFAAWGLDFEVNFASLDPALYEGSIVFETWANSTGCRGADAVLNATADVSEQELNQLTPALEGFIYFLFGITALTCIFFGLWIYVNRKVRIVQAMQPLFLIAMLLGLLLVSSATVPLSIDDGVVASERALDAACNAIPWLFSMGFTILFATIGVKLWRVNRIMRSSQSCRRVVLTVKDVMVPLMALFICNFSLNLIKSIMSPVHYVRKPIDEDEPGVTYGYCEPGSDAAAEATEYSHYSYQFWRLLFCSVARLSSTQCQRRVQRKQTAGLWALFVEPIADSWCTCTRHSGHGQPCHFVLSADCAHLWLLHVTHCVLVHSDLYGCS